MTESLSDADYLKMMGARLDEELAEIEVICINHLCYNQTVKKGRSLNLCLVQRVAFILNILSKGKDVIL